MKKITSLWANVARAYEIALAGDFTLKLVYNKIEYPSAPKDIKLIKKYYPDVKFTADGNLKVEIFPPNIGGKDLGEDLEDILNRVRNISNITVNKFHNEEAVNTLIKVAQSRLNLGIADIENIEKIAFVIAKLSNSELIQIEHVAEAIMYSSPIEDDLDILEPDIRVVTLDLLLNSEDIFDKWAQNKITSQEAVRQLNLKS